MTAWWRVGAQCLRLPKLLLRCWQRGTQCCGLGVWGYVCWVVGDGVLPWEWRLRHGTRMNDDVGDHEEGGQAGSCAVAAVARWTSRMHRWGQLRRGTQCR